MSFGGKGGSQTVVNKTEIRPEDAAYLERYRQIMGGQANKLLGNQSITPGMDPSALQAGRMLQNYGAFNPALQQAMGGYGNLYNLGFNAQGGLNTDAFMNPYEQQVIGGVQSDFDRQRAMAARSAGDLATQAGAFGGSRSAVLQGEMSRDINMNEAQQLANLRSSGYLNAQNMAANLGLTGLQGIAGLGQYGKGLEQQQIQGLLGYGDYARQIQQQQMMDPYMRAQMAQGFLGGGLQFPGGTSTQTQQSQMGWLPSLLGIGAVAGGLGLPALAGNALFGLTGMGGNL